MCGHDALRVTCVTPRPVPGGFRASGRWAFGSGIRHAEWIVTSAAVQLEAAGAPDLRATTGCGAVHLRVHDLAAVAVGSISFNERLAFRVVSFWSDASGAAEPTTRRLRLFGPIAEHVSCRRRRRRCSRKYHWSCSKAC